VTLKTGLDIDAEIADVITNCPFSALTANIGVLISTANADVNVGTVIDAVVANTGLATLKAKSDVNAGTTLDAAVANIGFAIVYAISALIVTGATKLEDTENTGLVIVGATDADIEPPSS